MMTLIIASPSRTPSHQLSPSLRRAQCQSPIRPVTVASFHKIFTTPSLSRCNSGLFKLPIVILKGPRLGTTSLNGFPSRILAASNRMGLLGCLTVLHCPSLDRLNCRFPTRSLLCCLRSPRSETANWQPSARHFFPCQQEPNCDFGR